jgi:two-component system nitrate/nitrite response regulator NarL
MSSDRLVSQPLRLRSGTKIAMAASRGPVRVVIADDHPAYRDGLASGLKARPDIELVGSCSDGPATLAALQELQPDVGLLDLGLPGLDGLAILDTATRTHLPTRIAFVSAHVEGPRVHAALAAGAAGYLSKETDLPSLCDAVTRIAVGEVVVSPALQASLAAEVRARGVAGSPVLSAREQDVLRLVADGLSTAQIAAALYVSPATAKTHLSRAYDKLGVSDRAAAVAAAMRAGILR